MSDAPADDLNTTPRTTGHLLAELITAVHLMREEMRDGFARLEANVRLAHEASRDAVRRVSELEQRVDHLRCSPAGGNGRSCDAE